jgi:putative ABC transport system permease protein
MLRKNYVFAAVSILALAIGIAANTSIFSLVNGVLLRQLPFKDPESLVWIWGSRTDREIKAFFSIPDFIDMRDQTSSLAEMCALRTWGANLTDRGDPERFIGVRVTANTFRVLGVSAVAGRALEPDDDQPGSDRVVVLGYGLWKTRFGADPRLVGQSLTLNGDPYTVAGVLPPDFNFPGQMDAELATPIRFDQDPSRGVRETNILRVFGKLKEGVTIHQARSELTAITDHLRDLYPATNAKYAAPKVLSMQDEIVGGYRTALLMLLGAVLLVLLIACSNLANLLLARATARKREFALRIALGATRRDLIKQLLNESVVLSLLGGILGLILASKGIELLLSLSPSTLPRSNEIGIDWKVLGFTTAISVMAGIIFGLAPALQASKVDVNEMIKSGGRGSVDSGQLKRTRGLMVVWEVALSVILLIGAGLLIRSFQKVQEVDGGFNTRNLLLAQIALPQYRYTTSEDVKNFYDRISVELDRTPGVMSFSAINVTPMSALNNSTEFTIAGRPPRSSTDLPVAQNRWIGPGYFSAMGIPITGGREFTNQDISSSRSVVVIDRALADRFMPGENPIGMHVAIGYAGAPDPRDAEIVGVVGNVKHFALEESALPTIYAPFYQIPKGAVPLGISNRMTLVIRTGSEPLALAQQVRDAIKVTDKDIPATGVKSMDQLLESSMAPRRFNLMLLTVFSITALLLAATGVYAMVSYSVTQCIGEIGIRMSVGALPGDIFKLMAGSGMKSVFLGLLVGIAGALVLTRAISSLLFEVSAIDPVVFLLVPILLSVMALLAVYLPARRATRVDPVVTLRKG